MKVFIKNTLFAIFVFFVIQNLTEQSVGAFEIPVSSKRLSSAAEPVKIPDKIIYKQSSYKINATDPTSLSNLMGLSFPGQRGPNQLIIYTPKYGLKTGTNEFGSEAVVIDGIVQQMSGADSMIPKDGFVISGHGNAKKWINENLGVGAVIEIDEENKIINSYIKPESFIFAAKVKIKETCAIMDYYTKNYIYYNPFEAQNYISKSNDYLEQAEKKPDDVQKYAGLAIENSNLAIEKAIPYYKDEFKGVWIRPTQKTPAEIAKTVAQIKSMGIDNIFLETYFHGKTIFPSQTLKKYGVTSQRGEFVGFDPLEVWICEAHKNGLKVHIWFETFYIGNDSPQGDATNILNIYPAWNNVTRALYDSLTPVSSISEHNGYFIDPANPAVQTFLLSIIDEILTKYKPDGINLDYIRYPQTITTNFKGYEASNWGYTKYAREEFQTLYGIDPIDITYNTEEWNLWAKYRQDKVTSFVAQVRKLICEKPCGSDILLTTVIFPDRRKSLDTKMQDWKTWSVQNLVDGFTPLVLTCDNKTASLLLNDIKRNSNVNTKIYPGLFVPFMGGASDDLLRQIHETRKLNTSGVVLFDYGHMSPKYTGALLSSVFDSSQAGQNAIQCSPQITQPTPKTKKRILFWKKK